MRDNLRFRIRFVTTCLFIFALIIGGRLYFVQVVLGESFAKEAEGQYVHPQTTFDRGSIFFLDKDGTEISAATLAGGHTLAIQPNQIEDPEALYQELSSFLEIDKDHFLERAALVDDPYEEIARKVPENIKNEIDEKDLPGILFHREYWRSYPGQDTAAQTLGFVAFNDDRREGRYGVEASYEDVLSRGHNKVSVNFFAEIFSHVPQAVGIDNKNNGDVVLTIEPVVQHTLERILGETRDEWGSKWTAGIIMDPKTGEIYAMAENPTFDLNEFGSVDDPSLYSNSLVERVYEMGSIVKPLTVAAGLDADVITPHTTYEDKGSVKLNGYTISNYDGEARGVVSMQEVLNQSLNTGVTNIMLRLGTRRFGEYFKSFGLGERTEIDLPGEARGLIENLSSPREVEYATASFGQGIALSPIAMTRALSALGNGGTLPNPHVVKRINYDLGYSEEIEVPPPKRVIKKETSEEITRMLVEVVDDALLGGTVALPRHSIAAKTGTAQIAKENSRGYYEDRFIHSFFGYFPAYDPRFIIFLINTEPRGARYASETLTHPFMDLVDFLISYYSVPPDR